MRVGITLPHYDFSLPGVTPARFEAVAAEARRAEALGFDSVWMSDHLFGSLDRYGGDETRYGALEPLTTLAALAPLTERVRLGTLVLSAAFRHPAIVAKAITAIDGYSSGRAELGIGAGWYEDEYAAFGLPFGTVGERFSLLEETLGYLDALFDGEPATFRSSRFELREAYDHPRPVQEPRPPIIVGGKGGPRMLSLAARLADGWNAAWRWTPERYGERADAARVACERAGRDPSKFRLSLGLFTIVGEDERDLERRMSAISTALPAGVGDAIPLETLREGCLAGTPEQVLERVSAFAALGVDELIVCPAPVWFATPDPSMVELIASLLPSLREL